MSKQFNHNTHAEKLRSAARESEPAFSEALHARVMSRVRREAIVNRVSSRGIRWLFPIAAAAMVVLGIWVWRHTTALDGHGETPRRMVVKTQIPSLPPRLIDRAADPARTQLEQGKYAYLDHDARRLAMFLKDQLDF